MLVSHLEEKVNTVDLKIGDYIMFSLHHWKKVADIKETKTGKLVVTFENDTMRIYSKKGVVRVLIWAPFMDHQESDN